jgi:outer membrane protein assembly factor BamB
MVKINSNRLVLAAAVLVLCGASSGFDSEDSERWLVLPRLLKSAKLEVLWDNELPIKKGENLKKLFILGERVYALSDRNYLISLDREKGQILFSKTVAAGAAVDELRLYEDELMFVLGSTLVELDVKNGTERKARRIEFGIKCPAARNSEYFYISGADRRLHVLNAEDGVEVFEAAAENNSMITSIAAGEDFVVFGTDAGNMISMAPNRPTRLWQFDAGDGIVGQIVRNGTSLFFASKDMQVYRVDAVGRTNRRLAWKYQMPGVLERAPTVADNAVYQYARGKGLTAIDREKGRAIWSLADGVDLLAEAAGKAYVITKDRKLVVMDNAEAKKLYSVNFARVSRYAVNATDPRIYIGDENGRVACLRPAQDSGQATVAGR